MPLAQYAYLLVDFGKKTCDCGLSGSGISAEHQMQAHCRLFYSTGFTDFSYLDKIDQGVYILLDIFKTNQLVQFGQIVLE